MKKQKISDFRPQEVNANRHTIRGMKALDDSISHDGWIGSITVAADGETFDGSARLETVYSRLGAEVDPIVIEIDGTRPVIVKRSDIPTADDPRAKRLAIAANRIAELNLDFDPDVLSELNEEVDLSGLWTDEEFSSWIESLTEDSGKEKGARSRSKEVECECPNCGHQFAKTL